MSQYHCPVCQTATSVIETRVSNTRLRRRRSCPNNHRFTTIELPHKAPKQLRDLIDWISKQGLDAEIGDYAREQVGLILFGTPEED